MHQTSAPSPEARWQHQTSNVTQSSYLGVGVYERVDGVQLRQAKGVEHLAASLDGNTYHAVHAAHLRSRRLQTIGSSRTEDKAAGDWVQRA